MQLFFIIRKKTIAFISLLHDNIYNISLILRRTIVMPRAKGTVGGAAGGTPAAELKRQIATFGLSKSAVAKAVGLNPLTLNSVLTGKKKVDIELALLFGKYFGTGETLWIELQRKAGLAEAKKKLAKKLQDLKKAVVAKADAPKKGPKPGAKRGTAAGAKRGPRAGAGTGPKPAGVKKGTKRGPKPAAASSIFTS
jgi:plasmid maintenance system antidote protein VapI